MKHFCNGTKQCSDFVLLKLSCFLNSCHTVDGLQQETSASALAKYELFPRQTVKEKPPLTVVGDVGGRIAIIVDDIIDEAQSFVDAAEVCCFSNALFSKKALAASLD